MMTAIAATMSIMIAAASPKVAIPSFPWENDGQVSKPSYLYMEGGFLTTEKGCPDWGTSNPSLIQFIGDNLGQVVITYSDGKEETVPLVIGYTIWIHGIWMENPAPFKGNHAEPEYSQLIQSSLSLKGGFEGSERGVLRIALSGKDVKSGSKATRTRMQRQSSSQDGSTTRPRTTTSSRLTPSRPEPEYLPT